MNEFIQKVAKMRLLQKQYFKSRDPESLKAAKLAEREVDAMLQQVGAMPVDPAKKPCKNINQPTLF
jgi:cell fate (sporulation/competence/biofilm development) regulator YmcA (YheA/YmcA/DUF963 family)